MTEHQTAHLRMLDLTFVALVIHRAVYAATVLGIPDILGEHKKGSDAVAEAANADSDATYRLMRALSSAGVLTESEGKEFSLTELGSTLRSDIPGSMRGWVLFAGSPFYAGAWQEVVSSIQTGKPGWVKVHGTPFFDYLGDHPDAAATFDAAMTSLSSWEAKAVVEAYDFSSIGTLVDVGGGQGGLLAAVLKANPELRGVVFDQLETVSGAHEHLAREGLAERCEVVGGDFFDFVPPGDAYLLKYIVHDWDDEQAIRILANCRKSLAKGGKVLLVETVVPGPNEPDGAKIADLEMLVLLGSRERTEQEFGALLDRADLTLNRIVPTREYLKIVEAVET